jgi:hypothetical protein
MSEKIVGESRVVLEELIDSRRRTVLNADMLLAATILTNQLAVNASVAAQLLTLPIQSLVRLVHHCDFLPLVCISGG